MSNDNATTTQAQDPAVLMAEIERLKAENTALKTTPVRALSCKVAEKGGLSVYGLGRFPVTLYVGQWERLLTVENVAKIQAFIKANADRLTRKE
mgnify:CR=1 FL=1